MNFSVGRRGTQRRPRICAVPSNAERARFPLGGFSRVPPWKPGRSEVARSGREGVWEKGIHPQDLASLLPPHWPLSFRARDRARRLFAFSPLPSPCLGRPPTPCPPGRPGCPWSSPVLWKPRHTRAGRPEHPRGRGARVTSGGPPGPCPSRAGGEAARLPSSARRAGSLLFASPRGFPESTPRPTPTLPCPTPGRPGAGPSQGTLAARALRSALLAPLHCASAREGTPRLLRLEERTRPSAHGFGGESVPGPGGSPGTRGRGRGGERAASCSTRSAPGARFLAGLGGGFLSPGEARRSRVCTPPGATEFCLAASRHPCAGGSRQPPAPRCRPGCNVRPAATPSRLSCCSWTPAPLQPPGPSCQKGGTALLPPEEPAGAAPGRGTVGSLGVLAGGRANDLGRAQGTKTAERGAPIAHKGREERPSAFQKEPDWEEGLR